MKSAFYRQLMYCPECRPARECGRELIIIWGFMPRCVFVCPIHGPVSVAIIPQEDIPGT